MVQFNGHFDGRTIVPDEPVSLPSDRPLRITVEEVEASSQSSPSSRDRILEIVRQAEEMDVDLPSDFAAQHDHYLHGAPKR